MMLGHELCNGAFDLGAITRVTRLFLRIREIFNNAVYMVCQVMGTCFLYKAAGNLVLA